ncbi:unnamed protein product [Ilex paraguariensis]|uniref:Aminotransferase-like plant mobile domain-containing protein n=1 Tax=Ilex paraguariensis TaxID=185542 RepID=A0ABC8T1T2_9AQUA
MVIGNFSTRFSLPSFIKRMNKLTECQKDAIKSVGFGNLLQIPDQMPCKNLLVELMERWSCEKLAFILLPGEIRITLMDVALDLGLRLTGKPVILKEDAPSLDLGRLYGATVWNRKITVASIEERLESLDKVKDFAWGAAVHEEVLNWLCRKKETNVQYAGGCLIFLQEDYVWTRPEIREHWVIDIESEVDVVIVKEVCGGERRLFKSIETISTCVECVEKYRYFFTADNVREG